MKNGADFLRLNHKKEEKEKGNRAFKSL